MGARYLRAISQAMLSNAVRHLGCHEYMYYTVHNKFSNVLCLHLFVLNESTFLQTPSFK